MKLISLSSLNPGEQLSSAIRLQDGRVLLPANATITDIYIRRLRSFGIESVYIADEFFDEVQIKPCISNDTKSAALSAVATAYKHIAAGKPFNEAAIKASSRDIFMEVRSSMTEPINLFNMYAVEDPRYLHAVNVACIVSAMAIEHGCSALAAEEYTRAALLHDIMLSDMQGDSDTAHAEEASALLKKMNVFSAKTYMSVALHHEKYDGTGGPRHMKGDAIHEGAKMLAVADAYDNLVYGYNCKRMSLHLAVEYLNAQAGKDFDPNYLRLFNSTVAIYPTGATVVLDNGYKAVVVGQNDKMPTRPKVRLAMNKREDCLLFNLLSNKTMFISSVEL